MNIKLLNLRIMKKFLLVIVASLFVTGAFAQDWSIGARAGAGLQVMGQYDYASNRYLEARFGMSWSNTHRYYEDILGTLYVGTELPVTADFTVLHNWRLFEFDWTPSAGIWNFDAGVGVNVGGRETWAYVGAAGMARLSFTFNNIPLTLGADWTPSFGPSINYTKGYSEAYFNYHALTNFAVSCTYRF